MVVMVVPVMVGNEIMMVMMIMSSEQNENGVNGGGD